MRHHSSVDVIFRRFIATFRRDKELNVVKITGCVPGGEVEAAGLMGVRIVVHQSVEKEFGDSRAHAIAVRSVQHRWA